MTSDRRRNTLELGAVALLLMIVAAAVYGPQAIHGGFLSDAWSNRALYVFSEGHGFFGKVGDLLEHQPNIAARPLLAVYLVALNTVFGSHVGVWLVWQAISNVVMCLTLFLLLRRLSLTALDAGAIVVLVLIFPAATSIRFWLPTIWAPIALALTCAGFLLALRAFEAKRRRRALGLHAGSLACFVASILLYEVALLVMLASVLLYRLEVPWGRAAKRWILDCATLGFVTVAVNRIFETHHESTAAGVWTHAKVIAEQARILFLTTVLPLSSASWHVLFLLALVPVGAFLAYRWMPSSDIARSDLLRWLLVLAAGLVVVALGYAIFVPGSDYYTPTGPGIANRVNLVPSIGWVLVLYAGLMLVTTLAARGFPRARLLASGFAILACGLIAGGWLKSISTDSDNFTRAYEEDLRVLAAIQGAIPEPRSHSTIWTFGQPVELVQGVPIFGNTWDMTTSVQLSYGNPTILSYVAYPETGFRCEGGAVVPNGPSWGGENPNRLFGSPYGRTYFVDTSSGEAVRIDSAAQCRAAAGRFEPSPQYPPA